MSENNQQAGSGNTAGGDIYIGSINQKTDSRQALTPKEKEEIDYRKILLNRVKTHWLSDQSSKENIIELRLQKNYDCDAKNNHRAPEFTNVAEIFARWKSGQALLILGKPGAGKTTALLQLAQNFVNRAEKDNSNQQLPVVFDLSSWGDEREPIARDERKPIARDEQQPIANWLVKELHTKYFISNERLRKTWVNNRQMILFLDGLNEVKEKYRWACVEAINQFRQDYGQHEIIVCSRTQEYKDLDKRLKIKDKDTVCVQPLESEQIYQCLDRCGEELEALKALLQEDAVLKELAETPLMLYVMRIAHKNLPTTGSLEERRSYIFKTYINEIFKRERQRQIEKAREEGRKFKEDEEKYQKNNVRTWLKWLANKMSETSKTVFLIEEMQPSSRWLKPEDKKAYRKLVTWYSGILFGLLFGTAYGTILHYYLLHLSPQTESTLIGGVFFGMIQGIIIGPIATLLLKVDRQHIKTYGEKKFSWGEYLKNLKNTFRNFINIRSGIGIGLGVFLICWLIMPTFLHSQKDEAIITGLIAGGFFGIVTLISRATGDSFLDPSDSKNKTVEPNQGIWDLRSQALAIAIISAVSMGIIYTLIILIIGKADLIMFILGLCTAVITGLVAILIHSSGRNCGLHYALRIVLEKKNHIPHNYADFLNYATGLNFMKRIGGGYAFYHELLKEHINSDSFKSED